MPQRVFIEDFQPRSELITPEHQVPRSKSPVIDVHNHLPLGDPRMDSIDLGQLVREMDLLNVRAIVNLSGGFGDRFERTVDALDRAYPRRIYSFCNVDWEGVGGAGWADQACKGLERDVRAGARGLKIFKRLGLSIRDRDDELLRPDDERIADLWDQAGMLGIPVLIHVADPVAFFRPLDRYNERWDELHRRPEWSFYGPEYPGFDELIASLYRLIEAHPQTMFITAHVGCYPENLRYVYWTPKTGQCFGDSYSQPGRATCVLRSHWPSNSTGVR